MEWGNSFAGVPLEAQREVTAIAAGWGHTAALKNDGTVIAWGANHAGQISVPAAIQSRVVAIASGWDHTVALMSDGTVVAWGANHAGQTDVPTSAQSEVAAIAAGDAHTVALKNDGTVVAWGSGYYGQTAVPRGLSTVVAVAAGWDHTAALLGDGKPVLTVQPWNRTVADEDSPQFAVMAVGQGVLRFQWQRDGTNLIGAVGNRLPFVNAQPSDSGNYACVVSNALGSVTSKVARLTVLLRPRLEPLPESAFAAVGSDLVLSANATGTPPLRYQWRKNGENIPGATNATYTLTNAQITDGGSYTVVVANDVGIAISSPTLVIVEVPQQPPGDHFADRVLITGATNSVGGTNRYATRQVGEPLHAGKYGSNSVWYRWVAPTNGIATFRTVGSTFDTLLGVYTGTNVAALTPVAEDEDRGGFFTSALRFNAQKNVEYAIAIDGFVGQQGTFILTWEVEPTAESLPVITAQPRSQTVGIGNAVTLSVNASGVGLTYQWQFNGVAISGANTTTLALNSVQPVNVGLYTVAITNTLGRGIVSLPAAVEIGPVPGVQGRDKLEDIFGDLREPGGGGIVAASLANAFISVAMGTVNYQITSTRDATSQSWEPNHCGVIGGASKWFEFHAADDATVVIDTRGSTFDTVLAVYRKVGVLQLAQNRIDCSSDWQPGANWSRVSFQAQRGSSYYAVVDGANVTDLTGRAQLNWAMGRLPRIEARPEYDQVRPGQRRRFTAGVTNAVPAPTYRWYHNNSLIVGATNDWFEIPSLQLTNAGAYSVVASNALGEVQQLIAQLSAPTITSELKTAEGQYTLTLAPVEFPGLSMVLESSDDLVHWTPVTTHTNATAPVSLSLPFDQRQRFFRTRPLP